MATRKALLGFNANKKTEDCTVKTCSRCGGKGYGSWRPVHAGVPGGCFECDLTGKVYFVTQEVARNNYVDRLERGLLAAREAAAACKEELLADIEAVNERAARRAAKSGAAAKVRVWGDYEERRLEQLLEPLREQYRQVQRELKRCQGGDFPRLSRKAY